MYLLDTNTVIYYFKGLGRVPERIAEVAPSEIVVPTPVLFELEVGSLQSADPKRRRGQLDLFLSVVEVLPFDVQSARSAAEIKAVLARRGELIGPIDLLVAGMALAHRATLVTHNKAEFSRIKGLSVADWY